jgi:photosystem II stability/assembly factor-like uncharacterized protein
MIKKHLYIVFIISIVFCNYFNSNAQSQYWEKVNIPAGFSNNYWLDIFFMPSNKQLGWICGYNGKVIKTIDGGANWTGYNVDPGRNPMLESIHFPSVSIGYASGTQGIWKSQDGGATWSEITPAAANNLWGCYFPTIDTGFVIGGGCGMAQQFFKTTNGGISWTVFTANAPNIGLCDLILEPGKDTGYASGSGHIWRTIDKGTTWALFSQSNTVNAWQEELAWLDNSFLVPFSGTTCAGGGAGGGMCFTTDLGNSWNRFSTPASMFGTYLTSPTTGWACGTNQGVYYTSDAGKNWEKRNCGTSGSLDDIKMFSDTEGWVVGEGVYTLKNAKQIVSPQPEINFGSLCVLSSKVDTITITNYSFNGTIATLAISGPAASDITLSAYTVILGSCETKRVIVQCNPLVSGIRTADIGITFSDPLNSQTIRVNALANEISSGKDTVSADSISVGYTKDTSVVFTNNTNIPITLTAIKYLDNSSRQLVLWNKALPLVILPKDSVIIPYKVSMTDTGWVYQRFSFLFGLCDKTITVKSYGITPVISTPYDFTMLSKCSTTSDSTLYISNVGNAPLYIDKLKITGKDGAYFLIKNSPLLPFTILPKQKMPITIQFLRPSSDTMSVLFSSLFVYHSDTLGNRTSPTEILLFGKPGYAFVKSQLQTVFAGKHCVQNKGRAAAVVYKLGLGPAAISSIQSSLGIARIVSPQKFPYNVSDTGQIEISTSVSTPGLYSDTLTFVSGPCKEITKLIVKGEALYTAFSFAPDTILTATVDQGKSTDLEWNIISTGTADADIIRMQLKINQEIQLSTSLPSPAYLIPGAKGIVKATVKPGVSDTVLIDTICIDASNICPYSQCFPIRITIRQASLSYSDTSLAFSITCKNKTQLDTVWIANYGQLPDTLLAANLIPVNGPVSTFSITSLPFPYTLQPLDSVPIIISFNPLKQGKYSAQLDILTAAQKRVNAPTDTIHLSGFWLAPVISANISNHDFGLHEQCSKDISLTITFNNQGLASDTLTVLPFNNITLDANTNLLYIKDSSYNTIIINYSPNKSSLGIWYDTLTLLSKTCGNFIKIPLQGEIDNASLLCVPSAVNFGQILKDDSLSQIVEIKNNGRFSVNINTVSLAINKTEYSFSSNATVPFLLLPDSSMYISVKAKGLTEGTQPIDSLVVIGQSSCNTDVFCPIKMTVPKEEYTATIRTERYAFKYGDTNQISVSIQGDLSKARIQNLDFSLHVDGKLFEITETNPKAVSYIGDSTIKWSIPAKDIPLQGGIIATAKGKSLISNPNECDLLIDSVKAETNRSISINILNGHLTISPYCNNMSFGLINRSLFSFKIIPSEQYSSSIKLVYKSTGEESIYGDMKIYNIQGALLFNTRLQANTLEKEYIIPYQLLSGAYFIELKSEDGIIQHNMVLVTE